MARLYSRPTAIKAERKTDKATTEHLEKDIIGYEAVMLTFQAGGQTLNMKCKLIARKLQDEREHGTCVGDQVSASMSPQLDGQTRTIRPCLMRSL